MEEINYFSALNAVNVGDKTEKKNGLTYLSWAWAWGEVKKRHPNASYTIYENAQGCFYHTDGKTCWVKTGVTVEGIEHVEYLSVMDFKNKSIPLDSVTSFDVNKAIQRSLTKAVARHGLGLYIYAGEDLPEDEREPITPSPNAPKKAEEKPKLLPKTPIESKPPTPEQMAKLKTLGGTPELAAAYYKTTVEELTYSQLEVLISKKEAKLKESASGSPQR